MGNSKALGLAIALGLTGAVGFSGALADALIPAHEEAEQVVLSLPCDFTIQQGMTSVTMGRTACYGRGR